MLRSSRYVCVMVIVVLIGQASAWAEDAKQKNTIVERAKSFWNPESMMEGACTNISAHYNLDAKQKEFTCKLLTERVTKFLDKHEAKIWPMLMELAEYQYDGKSPDLEAAKRIDTEGYDIFLDAKGEIMRAQADFRKILNEEQKKIHDRDLKGLSRQMDTIDRRFLDWRAGKTTGRAPLEDVRLAGGERIMPESRNFLATGRVLHESKWDKFVRDFIRMYQLDEGQKKTALTILKDLKDQVIQYRKTHRQELREANLYLREAKTVRPLDQEAIRSAQNMRDILNQFFEDSFHDLKERLELIPTEKQKKDYYQRFPHLRPPSALSRKSEGAGKPGTPSTKPTKNPDKTGVSGNESPGSQDVGSDKTSSPQTDKKKS